MGYVWAATFILEVILSFYLGFTCNFTLFFTNLGVFFLALLYSSYFGFFKIDAKFQGRENVIGMPLFFAVLSAVAGAGTKSAIVEYKIMSSEYTSSELQFKEKKYEYTSKWVEYKGIPFDYRQLPNGNFKLTRRLK